MSKKIKAYIFFGPPGSGKGTLARLCQEKFGWVQLSTGDLFRKHMSEGTELGKQIDFAMKSGRLVDDETVIKVVEQWIEEQCCAVKAFIFDGFPRTLVQAELFLKLINERLTQLQVELVEFEISDEVVIDRLSNRRVCENKTCQAIYSVKEDSPRLPRVPGKCDKCQSDLIQRSDDKPETIQTRLKIYHQYAQALFDFYQDHGVKKIVVPAEASLDQVFKTFVTLVDVGQ